MGPKQATVCKQKFGKRRGEAENRESRNLFPLACRFESCVYLELGTNFVTMLRNRKEES